MYTLCFDLFFDLETDSKWVQIIADTNNIFECVPNSNRALERDLSSHAIKYQQLQLLDYRYSPIEIIPIDNLDPEMSASLFNINNPILSEYLGEGVVRLFKDANGQVNPFKIDKEERVPCDNTVVSILAVPFYFSTSDLLLGFFENGLLEQISHIRIIKLSKSNRTMVLLNFKEVEFVDPFIHKYNGRKFTSLDPETCSAVKIKEIVFRKSSLLCENNTCESDKVKTALPYLLPDPFTKSHITINDTSNYVELATCPVCLERLDSNISGIVTTQCQHSYHCSCLSKWKEDKCPVCRYSPKSQIDTEKSLEMSKCSECACDSNLWICLVCGHIGCGRYSNEHAIEHFHDTAHCFAMDTETQRVWDYVSDGYVHRLVQNEVDGKLVELPLRDQSNKSIDAKVDKIGLEYSKILITQLESQREYFDEIIRQYKEDNDYQKETMAKMIEMKRKLEKRVEVLERKSNDSEELKKAFQEKEKESWKTKYEEELIINEGLVQNMDALRLCNDKLQQERDDLNEQIQDLMGHFQMEEQLKNMGDDANNGEIVIVPAKHTKKSKKKSNRK